jgi:hypothetical protein
MGIKSFFKDFFSIKREKKSVSKKGRGLKIAACSFYGVCALGGTATTA